MLELKNVSKTMGAFSLKNVSLSIAPQEYFVLLGLTGAGKTVVLELIAGINSPDSGHILFDGDDLTSQPPENRGVGFVYQDYALFPHLTVRENIAFGLRARHTPTADIDKDVKATAELLGISHLLERLPVTLSGGEQQRTALARALVVKPRVLLLDEPLSALDPRTKEVFQAELARLHQTMGTITIHVTHDFEEAMVLGDRLGVLLHGSLLQTGHPREVFERPASQGVAEFLGATNIFETFATPNGAGSMITFGGHSLHVPQRVEGELKFCIRPEAIALSADAAGNCNALPARITRCQERGCMSKVVVNVAEHSLTVMTSTREFQALQRTHGEEVYCFLPPERINTFEAAPN